MSWVWSAFWIFVVFGGSITALVKGLAAANERRAERAQERYRLRKQLRLAEVQATAKSTDNAEIRDREVRALIGRHQNVIDRWAAYELDPVRILEYPVIADVREPLVAAFHRAMLTADTLRPSQPDDLVNRAELVEYRDAVHELTTAFDAAEAEAIRRGWSDLEPDQRSRVSRAQRLLAVAGNDTATAPERAQALSRARDEIAGVVLLPRRTIAALERGVARALES